MYVRQSLHGQSLGFRSFSAILKAGNESIDLILSGISFCFLGAKYDNDSVVLHTDFIVLVSKIKSETELHKAISCF